jgi:CHAD domain-containing protein
VRRWAYAPPFTEAAAAPPSTLKRLTRRARRKADKRLRQAVATARAEQDDQSVDARLHRARKATKRARYAVELAAPVHKRAKKITKGYKKLQDLLGAHQDAVVAAELLREHATRADTPPSLTYGVLYARQETLTQQTRENAIAQHA